MVHAMPGSRHAALQPVGRWTASRKAAVVLAIARFEITAEQACETHGLSMDELMAWGRRHRTHGQGGLEVTKTQDLRL